MERWRVQFRRLDHFGTEQIRLQWAFHINGKMPYECRPPADLPDYVKAACQADEKGFCNASVYWKELCARLGGWNSEGIWDVVSGIIECEIGPRSPGDRAPVS